MKPEVFDALVAEMFAERVAIYKRKRKDYATADALSNFKRYGALLEVLDIKSLRPDIASCFTSILIKMDRIANLLKKKSVANESLKDSFMDLENYIDLLYGLIVEKKGD